MNCDDAMESVREFCAKEDPAESEIAKTIAVVQLQVEDLKKRAAEHAEVTTADVYNDSLTLSNAARELSLRLNVLDYPAYEESACTLWATAVLATRSHYRHVVGPPMLARAVCCEKLEDPEMAFKIYRAVILDFECVLTVVSIEAPIGFEDKLTLQYLCDAVDGALRCEPKTEHSGEWRDFRGRAKALLDEG